MEEFCRWQSKQNPKTSSHPDHWDHGLLLTGVNLYDGLKKYSSVIGNYNSYYLCIWKIRVLLKTLISTFTFLFWFKKKVWLGFLVCVIPNIVVPSTKAIILNLFMSSPMKWVTTWVWTMMGNQIRVIIVIQTSTLCLLFWVRAKSLGPLVQIKNYSNFLHPGKCSSLKNMKKGGTLWKK